jgi:thiamine biosynthesis lipoprotein
MATRFEIVLQGDNPVALRAAGEEALEEIDRLEAQLSLFRPSSELAHLNARAAFEPVRVSPSLFALLEQAQQLTAASEGAFDITIAPLVRCWGFMGGSGHRPAPAELAAARARVGMGLVELNRADRTVHFAREGMMLDLGAIGKGYAIERAAELLRDLGVTSALLHGGTSTVYGLGRPFEAECWRVAVVHPEGRAGTSERAVPAEIQAEGRTGAGTLAIVSLKDEALSVSAVWGKCFQAEGRTFGHILDPRTGEPATAAVLAAVASPSATATDALSTALLTLGPSGHSRIASLPPGMRTLVVSESQGRWQAEAQRICLTQSAGSTS